MSRDVPCENPLLRNSRACEVYALETFAILDFTMSSRIEKDTGVACFSQEQVVLIGPHGSQGETRSTIQIACAEVRSLDYSHNHNVLLIGAS